MKSLWAVLCSLCLVAGVASAKSVRTKVAVAPISQGAGAQDTDMGALEGALIAALGDASTTTVVPAEKVSSAVASSPDLAQCEGEMECLALLGKTVEARWVVYGEIGGLGDARIVFLKLIDADRSRIIRSTTLTLTEDSGAKALMQSAVQRLVAPKDYVGSLTVDVNVPGANVELNGVTMGARSSEKNTLAAKTVPVGTHALRVSHPEYRDYIRFVDVPFGEERIDVDLQAFPVVSTMLDEDLASRYGNQKSPWYARWYSIAGFTATAAVVTGIIVYSFTDGIKADRELSVASP